MPHFDIIKTSNPKESFRIASVKGIFDLQTNSIVEHFTGDINLEGLEWNIGVIYGASGTGKSTIAKELFGKDIFCNFNYTSESIIDDMPKGKSVTDITKMFNSVGFSSPKSWLKPYSVLSNGEKMRVDLANALLQEKDLIVFDEYTSVINREVAKIGSFALQKAVRKQNKKFIAVSCHNDILDWLEPDWTFCTDTMTFEIVKKKDQLSMLTYTKQLLPVGKCLASIII